MFVGIPVSSSVNLLSLPPPPHNHDLRYAPRDLSIVSDTDSLNPDSDPDFLLNRNLDPSSCWIRSRIRPRFFFKNTIYVFLNLYKGHSDSRRSVQPKRELSKHDFFFIFFIRDNIAWIRIRIRIQPRSRSKTLILSFARYVGDGTAGYSAEQPRPLPVLGQVLPGGRIRGARPGDHPAPLLPTGSKERGTGTSSSRLRKAWYFFLRVKEGVVLLPPGKEGSSTSSSRYRRA